MSNLWYCVKGLGFAIGCAIAFSGNSAIAKINQDATLPNNFGVATQDNIKNIKGEALNVLKFHYTIDKIQLQNRDVVGNQQAQEFLQRIEDGKNLQLACWVVNGGCVTFP